MTISPAAEAAADSAAPGLAAPGLAASAGDARNTGRGPRSLPRGLGVVGFLVAVLGLSWSVWLYGYSQSLGQVAARGQVDLALAADRLVTGLLRYRAAAVLLAEHPTLEALHDGQGAAQAQAFLQASADKTGAMATYYADRDGRILAQTQGAGLQGLAGAPWFQRAQGGALGADHGIHPGTGRRAYFYAAPGFGPDGQVRGVLVMVVDLDGLEGAWRGTRPSVFFTDEQGQVFVTNRSELMFWQWEDTAMVRPDGARIGVSVSWLGGFEIWRQRLSPYVPRAALHLVQPLPVIGLRAEALVDVAPAQRVAGLQAAVVAALCLVFGAALFVVTARRRALSEANRLLEDRVRARTGQLEETNAALRREVGERQDAEAALRQAQAELVQAGKLSALGQMSAGISHELNQPLMAIQQFAENGAAFLASGRTEQAGANLQRIAGLAMRAGRIIKNLRAFAKGEQQPLGKVDLRAVLDQAEELTEARLRGEGVRLFRQDLGASPIWVRGGEVRLAQVFVNLIVNAGDAMAQRDLADGEETALLAGSKRIDIEVDVGARIRVRVRDRGPGIADPDKLFEPFYSTKEVGEGMGLGLSISYGLVQSFGGNIQGRNLETGAEFTVELEHWREEAVA